MENPDFFSLMGFGPDGWGPALLRGAGVTILLALCGYAIGAAIGSLAAWAKISGTRSLRSVAAAYTTVLRGIPDLLVIYLFYFGGSLVLTKLMGLAGRQGFVDMPGFIAGALAVGIVSGAQHTEIYRGAYRAVSRGELEAALAVGMSRATMARRIVFPLVLRHALPGLGNVWQLTLKDSALVSVTGVVELLRTAQIGSGSSGRPFDFFFAAALIYLTIASLSGLVFRRAETRLQRGQRR
jgi:octopine/nopaline transport system permease protein